ncbi:Uncharacterised protein [Actinobacillus indolicus]|nr:Uncharacterised protein [Actinobacillus indolicus]VTU07424.1 Uncharacterised protein [Actinobacillus indolicus]
MIDKVFSTLGIILLTVLLFVFIPQPYGLITVIAFPVIFSICINFYAYLSVKNKIIVTKDEHLYNEYWNNVKVNIPK